MLVMAKSRLSVVLLEHLFVANIALNALGLWRSVAYWRKKRRHLRKPHCPLANPQELIEQQAAMIEALHERCEHYRDLSDQQRKFILKRAARQQASICPSCADKDSCSSPKGGGSDSDSHCPICWAGKRDMAFQCGHLTCTRCSLVVTDCPICRVPIAVRTKVYL